MTKRVLITGSAGFVGHHLVEHLLERTDWNIIGLDSFRHRGDSERLLHGHKWIDRYQIHTCDLSVAISHRLRKKLGHVDYIINVASESHVDRSIDDPVPFVQNNLNLVLNVLEFARVVKPEKFIQISTDEVYGPAPEGYDHKEWEVALPSNPYAASKAAQESIAISYWRTYGVPLFITNTMNMFGERQDTEKFIPMLIKRISKGESVEIHGTKEYIGKRKYLHARNHADALLFILNHLPPRQYSDHADGWDRPWRLNVVGDIELDNLSLAKKVAGEIGKPLDHTLVDFHAARPGHDRRYSLDGDTIARLGWKAPVEFQASLRKTIQWSLEHPEWLE